MKIHFPKVIILFILSFIIFTSCNEDSINTKNQDEPTEYHLSTVVVEIVDGDTYGIFYKNQKWRIRVLNVDAFETQRGERLSNQARKAGISEDSALTLGKLAKEFAKSTLLNKKVDIYRDYNEPNLDIYGRLLRITVVDGKRYDSLLKANGLAVPDN